MPINIYSVTNHLNSEGWTLISNTYKNLQTELEMKCPNGHFFFLEKIPKNGEIIKYRSDHSLEKVYNRIQ